MAAIQRPGCESTERTSEFPAEFHRAITTDRQAGHICHRVGQSNAFVRPQPGWRCLLRLTGQAAGGGRRGDCSTRTDGGRARGGSAKSRPRKRCFTAGTSVDRLDSGGRPGGAARYAVDQPARPDISRPGRRRNDWGVRAGRGDRRGCAGRPGRGDWRRSRRGRGNGRRAADSRPPDGDLSGVCVDLPGSGADYHFYRARATGFSLCGFERLRPACSRAELATAAGSAASPLPLLLQLLRARLLPLLPVLLRAGIFILLWAALLRRPPILSPLPPLGPVHGAVTEIMSARKAPALLQFLVRSG